MKVRNCLDGRWVGGGGWPEQMGIRLTPASTGVGVEVGAELGTTPAPACFFLMQLRKLEK